MVDYTQHQKKAISSFIGQNNVKNTNEIVVPRERFEALFTSKNSII
jgi:hypothetical protein